MKKLAKCVALSVLVQRVLKAIDKRSLAGQGELDFSAPAPKPHAVREPRTPGVGTVGTAGQTRLFDTGHVKNARGLHHVHHHPKPNQAAQEHVERMESAGHDPQMLPGYSDPHHPDWNTGPMHPIVHNWSTGDDHHYFKKKKDAVAWHKILSDRYAAAAEA